MQRKLTFLFIVFLIIPAVSSPGQSKEIRQETDSLIAENIPAIPQRIRERMEQYLNVRSATFSGWEASGGGILILTRFSETDQVHRVVTPGGARHQMTFFQEPVSFAQHSPDPERKGFLFRMDQGGGEFYQLYWFDIGEGRHRLLTDGGRSVNTSAVWSSSGKQIAYSSTKRNGKDFDIYVMDPADPSSATIALEVSGRWEPLDWSPDDSKLLVHHYISINESQLYVLDLKSGKSSQINPSNAKIHYELAVFGRDKDGIYFLSDEDSEFLRPVYHDLKSNQNTILLPDAKWGVEKLALSRDGKWVAYGINEGGISRVYTALTAEPGRITRVNLPEGVVGDLKFDPQSSRLGFHLSGARVNSDVYSVDLKNGEVTRWTYSEVGGLNPDHFVAPEQIRFKTFDQAGGTDRMIPAFYYKPKDESKKPFPVVISIHGGPESQARASFSFQYQYWVNELGLAVLVPNVRGSNGYGKSYLLLDNGMKREDSVRDIGALLDWIGTRPELDSKRVAVYGGSYGGYMVLSTMFHYNDRLRCAVDSVGISNFVTFLETTEVYRRDLRRQEYGDERDPKMRAFLNSISPTNNANKISKPLFVAQGANDPRVPMSESGQIVKAVRSNGGPVWYVIGKNEGHGFKKKENRDFYLQAMTLFLEEHLLK